MRVRWQVAARRDLVLIRRYIAGDNPHAAQQIAGRLIAAANQLGQSPHVGRPGRVAGTREFVLSGTPYIIPYRVREDIVEILRVYHAARRWPDVL